MWWGEGEFGGLLQAPLLSAGAIVNVGAQGAEPPEAATFFAFERHVLGCQNSTPQHMGLHVFHLIYTDLGDDKIWIKIG